MKEKKQSYQYQTQNKPNDFQIRMDNTPAWLKTNQREITI